MKLVGRYHAAAFLGSFLLFQLELIAAKLLLPRFGGAAYVWTTCLMFFQGVLLLGYGYARFVGTRFSRAHVVLLSLPILFFPIALSLFSPGAFPSADLLLVLARCVGLPFLALSTAVPILQAWLSSRGESRSYSVYGASNAGALLALLSYPFLVEPALALGSQLLLWQVGYALFVLLHLFCLPQTEAAPAQPEGPRPTRADRLAWLALAAGPSACLLAATNLLTLDFAALPLLWVGPLALYLLTFVLNFSGEPWKPPRLSFLFIVCLVLWLAFVIWSASAPSDLSRWLAFRKLWIVNRMILISASLFLVCMLCHRALALRKPVVSAASSFYVWTAAGGWAGSVLVAVLLPWLSRGVAMPELDWALAGAGSLLALFFLDRSLARSYAVFAVLLVCGTGFGFYAQRASALSGRRVRVLRNFYGYYAVIEQHGMRKFLHGSTVHGLQSLDPAREDEPMLYFHRRSPLGEAFSLFGPSAKRMGVVGLGAGVLAAYGRKGLEMDFYELDADVARIASEDFTFLRRSAARTRLITGDARLSLERDSAARYDLLVLDAFVGGAVPIHLLTTEAVSLYLSRLAPGGVMLFHTTNRFLILEPLLAAQGRALGLFGAWKALDRGDLVKKEDIYYSSWAALSRDPAAIAKLRAAGWSDLAAQPPARPWTDAHASVWSALRR